MLERESQGKRISDSPLASPQGKRIRSRHWRESQRKQVRAQHASQHVAPSKSSRKVSGFSSPGSSATMKGGLHWRPRFSIRRLNSLAACRVFQTDAYSPTNFSIRPDPTRAVKPPRFSFRTSKPLKSCVRRSIATAAKPPQPLNRSADPGASRASLASQSP